MRWQLARQETACNCTLGQDRGQARCFLGLNSVSLGTSLPDPTTVNTNLSCTQDVIEKKLWNMFLWDIHEKNFSTDRVSARQESKLILQLLFIIPLCIMLLNNRVNISYISVEQKYQSIICIVMQWTYR